MGLERQLFRLRRGGGTGATTAGIADIFGGKGGRKFSKSTRFTNENKKKNMFLMTLGSQAQPLVYLSQVILSLRVTMEHVIACVTKQLVCVALIAFDHRAKLAAQVALQANISWIGTHHILDWRCIAILLMRKVDDFVVWIGKDSLRWKSRWNRPNTIILLGLDERTKVIIMKTFTCFMLLTIQSGIVRLNI